MHTKRKLYAAILFAVLTCACADRHMIEPVQAQPATSRGDGPAARMFARMLSDMEAARNKNPEANRPGNNSYALLTVKLEDWYATEEARFAHALKIPNPVPADSGYRPGMTQQQYFEHLCKTEAGEFIYKTVDNVEGIYQLRPRRNVYGTGELQHLYAMEDPYGHYTEENENIGFQMVEPLKYSYFEIPVAGLRKYPINLKRFYDDSVHAPMPLGATIGRLYVVNPNGTGDKNKRLEYDTAPRARYGYTWRGIKRPHDRELGIGGGELIVLDLQTNEVLAVRRGYAIWNREWTYRVCPRYGYDGGEDKGTAFTARFVTRVVRPPRWKEYFRYVEETRKLPPGAKPFVE